MNLRGMSGLTASRITSESIFLEYDEYDEYGDGSQTVITVTLEKRGSVGILQPKEIERLEKAGIIVRNGATIVIKEAPRVQPERVIYGYKTYRVVSWAFDFEYEQDEFIGFDEYNTQYGTVVALCDEITIAGVK